MFLYFIFLIILYGIYIKKKDIFSPMIFISQATYAILRSRILAKSGSISTSNWKIEYAIFLPSIV